MRVLRIKTPVSVQSALEELVPVTYVRIQTKLAELAVDVNDGGGARHLEFTVDGVSITATIDGEAALLNVDSVARPELHV